MTEPVLSPSQFETFDDDAEDEATGCEVKWAATYSPGGPKIRSASTTATQLGTRLHAIAEDYHKTGKRPDLGETMVLFHEKKQKDETFYPGQIFNAGIQFNPPPKTARVEGSFTFTTNVLGRPIKWRGTKDLEWIDPKGGQLWVIDHKSTGNWDYEKTPDVLQHDTQGNIYAQEAIQRTEQNKIGLKWITYNKYTVDARQSIVVLSKPQVQDAVAKIERKAHRLLEMYKDAIKPTDAKPNRTLDERGRLVACSAYGGCQFANTVHCPAKNRITKYGQFPDDGEQQPMSNDISDFMKHVKSLSGGAPLNGAVAVTTYPTPAGSPMAVVPPPPPASAYPGHPQVAVAAKLAPPPPPAALAPKAPPPPPPVPQPVSVPPGVAEMDHSVPLYAPPPPAMSAPPPPPAFVPPAPPAPPSVVMPASVQALAEKIGPLPGSVLAVDAPAQASDEDLETIIQTFMARGHSREKAEEFVGITPRRPVVESGFINPPEAAGLIAMASPEEMAAPAAPFVSVSGPVTQTGTSTGDLESMNRDELKKLAVSLGVMTQSDRFGEPRIRELIRKAQSTQVSPNVFGELQQAAQTAPIQALTLDEAVQDVSLTQPEKDAIAEVMSEQLEANRPQFDADERLRQVIREELKKFFKEIAG